MSSPLGTDSFILIVSITFYFLWQNPLLELVVSNVLDKEHSIVVADFCRHNR